MEALLIITGTMGAQSPPWRASLPKASIGQSGFCESLSPSLGCQWYGCVIGSAANCGGKS